MPQYNGVWTVEQQAQALTNQQWVTDLNFKNTTLLLQADNAANGATNNSFLDSSANGFAISTNVGVPPQGSFSPFSQAPGYWGNYFGSSNYLTTPSSSAFNLSSGDWTIEGWFWLNTNSDDTRLFTVVNSSSDMYGAFVRSGTVRFGQIGVGEAAFGTVNLNTWNHIAFCKTSTSTITCFINGVSTGTTTSYTLPNANCTVYIAASPANYALATTNGYISNFRLVKGTAVYTSAFTPQTTPLTNITNTSLLTCQSNRFIDNSTNAFTITTSGTPTVQAFGPFAPALQWTPDVVGGSSYFAGANYLKTPSSSAFALGTGQFCLEAWHYPNNSNGGQILSTRTSGINQASSFSLMQYGATSYSMYANNNHVQTTMIPYQWNHVIVTRDSSNTLRLILNGVLGNYEASYTENITETILSIGALNNGGEVMYGYTTGHRITKGSIPTTYQTSSTTNGTVIFTPPTQPVTLTSQGATSGNVSFLCNYTNAGIYDGKMGNVFETKGNAQVATNPVKYGSGSMYFDGTAAALLPPASKLLAFGTGDFTVEVWVWPIAWDSNMVVIQGGSNGFGIQKYSSGATGNIGVIINGGWVITDAFLPITGQWSHIAVTRTNGVLRFFVNGSVTGSSPANTADISDGIKNVGGEAGQTYFKGYMDDIRVTKGVCRYIANFTPPQQALPRQ
jgi:hypothetical protein